MDEKVKELHSRRPLTTGRPPPPDFAINKVAAVSKAEMQKIYTVGHRTVERWWHDPDVIREEMQLKAEMRDIARARVLGLTPLAVDTLKSVMEGDHDPSRVKAAEAVLRISKVGDEEAEMEVAEGSIEEQARTVLATAAMILRDRGAVEAAGLVEAEREKILPDSAMNVIIDVEVADE